jgi:hypothetical protein
VAQGKGPEFKFQYCKRKQKVHPFDPAAPLSGIYPKEITSGAASAILL